MPAREHKIIAGRYEVVSQIGAGGVAVVYRARDPRLDKDVAVKMLHPELMTDEAVVRFQHEAKTASTLLHPNLIRVLDFGITEDNEPYLVMDYVDGVTLSDFLENHGPAPVAKAAGIFIQICDGMALAHEQGVLHRDLKSSNIMLTEEDSPHPRAFVLDFGLAKRTEDGSLTRTGVLIGSPLYMSPEHARGLELDSRADIYSLGCIMFETLTGTAPITGETVLDTIMKQTTEEAPAMAELCPDISFSPELEQIVATALRKDPDQRFQSMNQLKASLESLREASDRSPVATPHHVPSIHDSQFVTIATAGAPQSSAISKSFVLVCIILMVTISGIGFMVAPMVHNAIDTLNPHTDNGSPKAKEKTTADFDMTNPLTGASGWTGFAWQDGITWRKNFGAYEDSEFLDYEKFHNYAFVSFWTDTASKTALTYLRKAKLRGLYLGEANMTDEKLAVVGTMQTLEALYLEKNQALTDAGLQHLTNLKQLKNLDVSDNLFTDAGLQCIGQMDSLEILYIENLPKMTGNGLKQITRLKSLKKLDLSGNRINPIGQLGQITSLKNLRVLFLKQIALNDKLAEQIATMPRLEVLDVSCTAISDRQLLALMKAKTLKTIYIEGHTASQKVYEKLKRNNKIKVIDDKRPQRDNSLDIKY